MPEKESVAEFCLRKNLFFPSSEIYAGFPAGFWEFGPEGTKIKNNIAFFWRKELVEKEGFFEITGSEILFEPVFRASGHLKNFNDPITQCEKCHSFFRVDKLIQEKIGLFVPESMPLKEMRSLLKSKKIVCPKCGFKLGNIEKFNMMMKVLIGAKNNVTTYLRPETCQNIFLDFSRIYKNSRKNLPIGIAQVGNSFRNEIAPKQTILRERQLSQMEIEIFFNPEKQDNVKNFGEVKNYLLNLETIKTKKIQRISCENAVKQKIVSSRLVAYYLARLQQLYEKMGIPDNAMKFKELDENTRAFYSRETWDFEVRCEGKWIEVVACNNRTDYDLKQHSLQSRQKLSVKEEGQEFTPHVFELSAGLDRTFYALICRALKKEKRGPEQRVFLDLHQCIAPYFVSVFPLVKKDGLKEKAEQIVSEISSWNIKTFFDEKGSIGKRYARTDEIGVPFAVTIDYQTLKDNTVTLRERNTMKQKRIKTTKLPETLLKLKLEKTSFEKL